MASASTPAGPSPPPSSAASSSSCLLHFPTPLESSDLVELDAVIRTLAQCPRPQAAALLSQWEAKMAGHQHTLGRESSLIEAHPLSSSMKLSQNAAKSAFLPPDRSRERQGVQRVLQAGMEGGLLAALEALVPKSANVRAYLGTTERPGWLGRLAAACLALCRMMSNISASFYPHLTVTVVSSHSR